MNKWKRLPFAMCYLLLEWWEVHVLQLKIDRSSDMIKWVYKHEGKFWKPQTDFSKGMITNVTSCKMLLIKDKQKKKRSTGNFCILNLSKRTHTFQYLNIIKTNVFKTPQLAKKEQNVVDCTNTLYTLNIFKNLIYYDIWYIKHIFVYLYRVFSQQGKFKCKTLQHILWLSF